MNALEREDDRRRAFRRGVDNLALAFAHAPREELAEALEEKAKALRNEPQGDGPRGDQPPTAPLEERRFDEASTA